MSWQNYNLWLWILIILWYKKLIWGCFSGSFNIIRNSLLKCWHYFEWTISVVTIVVIVRVPTFRSCFSWWWISWWWIIVIIRLRLFLQYEQNYAFFVTTDKSWYLNNIIRFVIVLLVNDDIVVVDNNWTVDEMIVAKKTSPSMLWCALEDVIRFLVRVKVHFWLWTFLHIPESLYTTQELWKWAQQWWNNIVSCAVVHICNDDSSLLVLIAFVDFECQNLARYFFRPFQLKLQ